MKTKKSYVERILAMRPSGKRCQFLDENGERCKRRPVWVADIFPDETTGSDGWYVVELCGEHGHLAGRGAPKKPERR